MEHEKKRILGLVLASVTALGLLSGCGGGGSAGLLSSVQAGDGGKILNIYVWNEEFQGKFNENCPQVERLSNDKSIAYLKDGTEVHWIVNPTQDGVYQQKLDEALLKQGRAVADERVDMFLVEADYALKYVDPEVNVALPISQLGITDGDIANQYRYTLEAMTGSDGEIRGLSYQATPGMLVYRRSIAKAVLGTDDPEVVGAAVADWDKFYETAQQMKEAGYYMYSGRADTARVYSNNVSAPWVKNDKTVVVDPNMMNWVERSMEDIESGVSHNVLGQWNDEWNKDMGPDSKVFCFFLPFFLSYAIFSLIPPADTIRNSFYEYYAFGLKTVGPNWTGLSNYISLLSSDLPKYAWNTFVMWVLGFVPQIIISLVLASWFTDARLKIRGKQFFKVVIYLPNLIMASAFAMLFFALFSNAGPINSILLRMGVVGEAIRFMESTLGARTLVGLMNFLMWFGNTTIMLMAAIMGINPSIFEAAELDGCTHIQKFFKITLPQIKPLLPLIIPSIASPAVFYFMHSYMQSSLPRELIEAARIDGSREFGTFNRIVLPIMIATLRGADYMNFDMGKIYMMITIAIVPIIIIYLLLSKFIVEGVTLGGVKE